MEDRNHKKHTFLGNRNFVVVLSVAALGLGAIAAFHVSQQRTELATRASSPSINIAVMEDASVGKSKPTKNDGTDNQLKVDDDRASYLKFNFDSLAGQPITKATLRVYVLNESKSTQQIKGIANNNWSESGITFENQPEPGESVAEISDTKKNEWKEIDITEFVRQNSGKVASLRIDASADNRNNLYLSSREGGNAPIIIVDTTNAIAATAVPTIVVPTTAIVQQPSVTTKPSATPTKIPSPTVAVPTTVPPVSGGTGGIQVNSSAALAAALANAKPGDVITLADGTYQGRQLSTIAIGGKFYTGSFVLAKSGTAGNPIVIQGSRKAIIEGNGLGGTYGFYMINANYVQLKGFTVANAEKGIVLDNASNNLIQGLEVKETGMEGIHLRSFSSNNTVQDNYVHHIGRSKKTGVIDEQYAEGVYIGTANSNWGTYTNGQPDKSDNNKIIGNRIEYTGGEGIDVKEGTTNGLIENNTFNNAGIAGGFADSWIDVKGNNWKIRGNKGINALKNGYEVHGVYKDEWGHNNEFTNNVAENVKAYGFWLQNNVKGNVISCTNSAPAAPSGLANVPCTN